MDLDWVLPVFVLVCSCVFLPIYLAPKFLRMAGLVGEILTRAADWWMSL